MTIDINNLDDRQRIYFIMSQPDEKHSSQPAKNIIEYWILQHVMLFIIQALALLVERFVSRNDDYMQHIHASLC